MRELTKTEVETVSGGLLVSAILHAVSRGLGAGGLSVASGVLGAVAAALWWV
jgi:hypothetical protein